MPNNKSLKPSHDRVYHHGNLPAALVQAAGEVIAKQGVEHLTLRGVAEAVGVSRTAPYRHFASKEELVAAFATDAFSRLSKSINDAIAAADDNAIARLHGGCRGYVEFAAKNPTQYTVMFDSQLHQSDHPQLHCAGSDCFGILIDQIARSQKAGEIRAGDPKAYAFAVWAAMHGVVMLCHDHAPTVAPEVDLHTALQLVLDSLMNGLLTKSAEKPTTVAH